MHYLSSQLFLVVGVPGSRAVVEYFPAVVEYAGQIPRVAYQQQKRGKSCIALLQHKRAWQLKPNNTTTAKYTHITTLYLTSLWRRSVAAVLCDSRPVACALFIFTTYTIAIRMLPVFIEAFHKKLNDLVAAQVSDTHSRQPIAHSPYIPSSRNSGKTGTRKMF